MTSRLDDLVEGMLTDIAAIHTDIQWSEGFGYGQTGRGLDSEHGADLGRSEAERLAGPRFDIAIGDHGARLALQGSLRHLARTELLLVCANAAAGERSMPQLSTTLVAKGEQPTTIDLIRSVRVVAVLLSVLEHHLELGHGTRRVEKWAFRASQHLVWCRGGFSRALERGEVAKPSVPECCNGGCKNMASMRVLQDGKPGQREAGLCDRCARFKRRNGFLPSGHRLSAELDRRPYDMQNKRMAKGLGRGDESLSWAYRQPSA